MLTYDAIVAFIEKVQELVGEDNVFAKFLEKVKNYFTSLKF